MAENQSAMTAIDRFFQEFEQGIEFRRRSILRAEEPQVAASLPETEQGREHAHAGGAGRSVAQFIDLRARGLLKLRVGGFLLGAQFDFDDLLDLVWKLGKNFLLAAAQEIRLQGAGKDAATRRRARRSTEAFHIVP